MLPSGITLRGVFTEAFPATSAGQVGATAVSFGGFRLGGKPVIHYIKYATPAPAECPGTIDRPEAAAGHLCIHEQAAFNVSSTFVRNPTTNDVPANESGFAIAAVSTGSGTAEVRGSWAVTSP